MTVRELLEAFHDYPLNAEVYIVDTTEPAEPISIEIGEIAMDDGSVYIHMVE